MKVFFKEFLHRGFSACGLGPVILAVIYFILKKSASVCVLSVDQVCIGIFSLTMLAFIAGGMNSIYKIESLPLMVAILIHGVVLYISYLMTYLINGWVNSGVTPIVVFSIVFLVGYILIWACVYFIVKKSTNELNKALKEKP